jgi:hypothetical protein
MQVRTEEGFLVGFSCRGAGSRERNERKELRKVDFFLLPRTKYAFSSWPFCDGVA